MSRRNRNETVRSRRRDHPRRVQQGGRHPAPCRRPHQHSVLASRSPRERYSRRRRHVAAMAAAEAEVSCNSLSNFTDSGGPSSRSTRVSTADLKEGGRSATVIAVGVHRISFDMLG